MAIITISRGTFGGGEKLAECLSRRLGYRSISREVLVTAGKMFEASEADLIRALEEKTTLKERLLSRMRERLRHLAFIRSALCEEAKKDNLIYRGYAANLFLKGVSHVLTVKVIASMEQRISFFREHNDVSEKEAMSSIAAVDEQRKEWTELLYNADWNDPSLYAIVINLEQVTVTSACETIASLVSTPQFKTTQASQKAMDDLAITSRVTATLAYDVTTEGYDVDVETDNGVVTVSGRVRNEDDIETIERAIRKLPDVRDVKNACTLYTPISLPRPY